MIRFLLSILFLSNSIVGIAQILNQEGLIFNGEPFFNDNWIAEKKIKTIHIKISYKNDDEPIRRSSTYYLFEFNKKGQLVFNQQTVLIKHRVDTLEKYYQYNKDGKMVKVIFKDHYGFYSLNYRYNDEGLLISLGHNRERKTIQNYFVMESEVWRDSIANIRENDSTQRRVHHNSLGKPHKEYVLRYDKLGRLRSKMMINKIGGQFTSIEYNRNDDGQLISVIERSNTSSGIKSIERRYSENGWIHEEEFFLDNISEALRMVDYDSEGKITLHLYRDLIKKKMEINEFEYSYFH